MVTALVSSAEERAALHRVYTDHLINDSKFLLNSILSYDWENVIGFCNFMITQVFHEKSVVTNEQQQQQGAEDNGNNDGNDDSDSESDNDDDEEEASISVSLSSLQRRKQHKRVIRKKRTHYARIQLLSQDQWGNTILHAACYNKPPVDVIRSILLAVGYVPKYAGGAIPLHTLLSNDNSTPILVACATGASYEVIRLLLYPPSTLLLQSQPKSQYDIITTPDQLGCTPLSELIVQYELQRKEQQTHNGWGGRRTTRYVTDHLNLEEITGQHLDIVIDQHLQHHQQQQQQLEANQQQQQQQQASLFYTFWSKVQILLQAAWFSNPMVSTLEDLTKPLPTSASSSSLSSTSSSLISFSLLHSAAMIGETCPPVLINLLCRCYPEMISYQDKEIGLLFPLHYLLMFNNILYMNDNQQTQTQQQEECGSHTGIDNTMKRNNMNANTTEVNRRCYETLVSRKTYFIRTLIQLYPYAITEHPYFIYPIPSYITEYLYYLYPVATDEKLTPSPSSSSSVVPQKTALKKKKDFVIKGRKSTILCQAIISGLFYHNHTKEEKVVAAAVTTEYNNNHETNNNNNNTRHHILDGPLKLILNLLPELVFHQDSTTGFYPFMLAALETTATTNDKEERKKQNNTQDDDDYLSLFQTDTIYSLLRLHPQLLTDYALKK